MGGHVLIDSIGIDAGKKNSPRYSSRLDWSPFGSVTNHALSFCATTLFIASSGVLTGVTSADQSANHLVNQFGSKLFGQPCGQSPAAINILQIWPPKYPNISSPVS